MPQPDPFLGIRFSALAVDVHLRRSWQNAGNTPPIWWVAPPPNSYISRGVPIAEEKQGRDDAAEFELAKATTDIEAPIPGMPGVVWQAPCRPHLVAARLDGAGAAPAVLWHVPGCLYVSGQFSEVVQRLGPEPLGAVTLWLPADRVADADAAGRAAGRLWLLSLQRALEGKLHGAALAGCRWEAAFFAPRSGPNAGAGLRLAFEAYNDVLPRFASDVAGLIGAHAGPDSEAELEVVRSAALQELRRGAARRLEGSVGVAAAVESMDMAQVQKEALALWGSIRESVGGRSQALVAGRIGDDEAAAGLVGNVIRALPLLDSARGASTSAASARIQPGPLPTAVLTRRPTWQGPVAQSFCLASGVPALVDVCGRSWNR